MDKKTNETKSWLIYIASFILIGLILAVFVAVVGTSVDKLNAQTQMKSISQYIRQQCIRYEELAAEEVSRSLYDVSDRAFAIRSILDYQADDLTQQIDAQAEGNRLNGIIVTANGEQGQTVAAYYFDHETNTDVFKQHFDGFDTTAEDLFKCHSERLLDNGYYYDCALVARSDRQGTVLCYRRRMVSSVESDRYSISTLLKGYVFGSDGVVVVTDGINILATNSGETVGMTANEVPVVRKLRQNETSDTLLIAEDGGTTYYGIRSKVKNMYIYTYMPSLEVFSQRSTMMSYTMMLYLLAVAILVVLRSTMLYGKRMEEQRREEIYSAEKEKLAQQAIRANEVKTDFLRRMSHDLRTPINGIRGMLKIGDYYHDDMEKQIECRQKIWATSDYLLDLVNDLLEMNQLSTEEDINWKDEKFVLTGLFEEVTSFTAIQAKEAGLTFVAKTRNIKHDFLFGGKTQLKRIFSNLIANAIKYNKPSGNVTVTCTETGFVDGYATFDFICADTGVGMSKEFVQKMYEPFERENRADGKTLEGVGLGLSIVNKLVDKAGWTIDVNTKKGVGTTFTVHIRLQAIDVWATETPKVPTVAASEVLSGRNVLVAEDNELNYEIVEFMLQVSGATVIHAADGKQAIDIFAGSEVGGIDVILMDVMMPNVDGLTATRTIRDMDRADAKTVPIVAMTASAFADDIKAARTAGMNAHIAKPIDGDKLVRAITQLLHSGGGGIFR